ncbi:ribonuclease H family protein [Terrisporobacter petrolearius]|uniref:ribonuclease H family protein n=1 Tax=Terrisporobacter petrolearius TaxID=1460447 RepID=UPI0031CCB977
MSKKKYYAVKVGKTPGIYFNWADCSAQVTGYKGAKYKSFPTIEEAMDFIGDTSTAVINKEETVKEKSSINKKTTTNIKELKEGYNVKPIRSTAKVKTYKSYINPEEIINDYEFIAFVDGSYDRGNQVFGSGVIVLDPNNNSHDTYYNAGYDKWDQWNIVGELESVKVAINKAKELGKQNIAIYHDLKNIALWASGEWQAKNEYTQEYVRYIEKMSAKLNICFVKVKAHSNESVYNDLADEAAKGAIIKYLNENK